MDSPLVRQWTILQRLSNHRYGVTVRQLSDELDVSDKTIRRDLSLLQDLGFPLDERTVEFGRKLWRLDPNWPTTPPSFTFDEALALYLGRRWLRPLSGTMIWDAAERAFDKVESCLGEAARQYVEKLRPALGESTFGVTDYSNHREVLDKIFIGIEDRRVVFITYRSERSTEPVTYDIHPYRLRRHRGSLYLYGHKPDDGERRTWKVDRIERAEVDVVPFSMPDPAEIDRELSGTFGVYHGDESLRATVWFSPQVARYVQESHWHPSQQEDLQPDGSLLVTFQLTAHQELTRWLLSFGPHAHLRDPPWLQQQLADEIKQMQKVYESEAKFETGEEA